MELLVIELCSYEDAQYNIRQNGYRLYKYEAEGEDFISVVKDMTENFNCDNILASHDYFEGVCLESEIISIERSI